LRFVAVEQLGEQGVELPPFGRVEPFEELILDRIGVPLQFFEVLAAGSGQRDDVAAPVGRIGLPAYVPPALDAVENAIDVVAVETTASSAWLSAPYSSSAANTAKSARAPSGTRRAVSRAPSVDTLLACHEVRRSEWLE
jgi:hypothetical protein